MTMIQSASSASSPNVERSPANAGVLAAQLDRYERQLADWCHCPSGKSPEGKEKIKELQQKADAVRQQLQRIDAQRARAKGSPAAVGRAAPAFRPGHVLDLYA